MLRFFFSQVVFLLVGVGSVAQAAVSPPTPPSTVVSSDPKDKALLGKSPLLQGKSPASPTPVLPSFPGPQGFADTVAPLLPAVVNISVIKQITTFNFEGPGGGFPGGAFGGLFNDPSRFREFLDQFHVAPKKRRVPVGVGSGFIISPEGHVVTNAHVVEGAHEVIVTLSDRSEMRAQILGVDPNFDLALLKVTYDTPLPYVQWGDASAIRIGDWAIAIGNPLGLGGTVTLGIISHVGRSFLTHQTSMGGLLQTDAAINMGNSGGPLFNVEGKVIGINMMIASGTGGNIGIGFAIPSDTAQFVINQLKVHGRVKRGWIGVQIQPLNQEIAKNLKLKIPQGALVGSVIEKSPAAEAGVLQTDVVLRVGNVPIEDASKLSKVISGLPIGSKVPLVVWRKNKKTGAYQEVTLEIKIAEFEEKQEDDNGRSKEQKSQDTQEKKAVHGLSLQELTPALRKKHSLCDAASGLLVTKVDPESRAAEVFQPGDLLIEVNQQKVVSHKDFGDQIKSATVAKQSSVLCLIQRQGVPFFLSFSIEPLPKTSVAPSGENKRSSLKSFFPKFIR
jgi:serine protease Do